MAYSTHIERHNATGQREPIEIHEWIEAVRITDWVRLASHDEAATNSATGESIVIKGDDGNAEFHSDEHDAWLPVFRWNRRGLISFDASSDFGEETSRLREAATELARNLNARLVGDEGEFYS